LHKIQGFRAFAALMLAVFALAIGGTAQARVLQCVPFAREISGIQLHGNAHSWWGQAEGAYERGREPRVGAVMAFASSRSMPVGHVAMVSRVVNDREVLLTHANWSRRGGIERDVRAVDVSAAGDWSQVRVWYGPIGDLGLRPNPVQGFIYPSAISNSGTGLIARADPGAGAPSQAATARASAP
jgi:surface antigen